MFKDSFADQVREAAEDDDAPMLGRPRPPIEDLSLAGQIAWLRWMAPDDPKEISVCDDDEIPMVHAILRSLTDLAAA